jgi:hypothetical protein
VEKKNKHLGLGNLGEALRRYSGGRRKRKEFLPGAQRDMMSEGGRVRAEFSQVCMFVCP